MKRTILSILLATLALAGVARAEDPGFRCSWEDVQVREGFVLPATDVTLERPWITVRFTEGTFYGLEACDRLVGLAWAGDGEFTIEDPGSNVARLLHERLENLPGVVGLEQALVFAGDGAVTEIVDAAGAWQEGTVPIPMRSMVQARVAPFEPGSGKSYRPAGGLLFAPEPALGGIFMDLRSPDLRRAPSEIMAGRLPIRWLAYRWSWHEGLRNLDFGSLAVRGVGKDVGEVFATLPPPSAPPDRPGMGLRFNLLDAEVHARFERTSGLDRDLKDVDLVAHLELEALEGAPRTIDLTLMEGVRRYLGEQWAPLRVKGVRLDGVSVPFDRVKSQLFVPLPEAPAAGTRLTVDVLYEGAIVEPAGQAAIDPLSGAWYPSHWPGDRHTLTTVVTFPKFWKMAATGRRIEVLEDGTMRTVTSRTDRPVERAVVFLVDARLHEWAPPAEGLPKLRVLRSADTPAIGDRFAEDVYAHLATLNELLGPFPYEEIEIVERRAGGGWWGTPGVIALGLFDSPPNILLTTDVGPHTLLQALVRQFLVADMGGQSFRESWLIEGLSMLAECFTLDRNGHQGRCVANLSEVREVWSQHLQASTSAWPIGALALGDYAGVPPLPPFWEPNSQLRGPLVMHRLRLLLGEEPTWVLVHRIATTYRGRRLSSESFRIQAQGVAPADLSTFFTGMVDHTPQQPVARLTWRTAQEEDGSWTLHLNGLVDSGRSGDPLPVVVPFMVGMKLDKNQVWQRIVLTHEAADLEIRGIPVQPKKLRLDEITWPGKVELKKQKR